MFKIKFNFKGLLLLALMFLLVFMPSVALAQDGEDTLESTTGGDSPPETKIYNIVAAEEDSTVDDIREVGWLIVQAIAAIIGLLIMMILTVILMDAQARWKGALSAIDGSQAILDMGNSPFGKMAHGYMEKAYAAIDDPDDPLVKSIQAQAALVTLSKIGLFTPEQFTDMLANAVALGVNLTDGIPNVDVKVVPKE